MTINIIITLSILTFSIKTVSICICRVYHFSDNAECDYAECHGTCSWTAHGKWKQVPIWECLTCVTCQHRWHLFHFVFILRWRQNKTFFLLPGAMTLSIMTLRIKTFNIKDIQHKATHHNITQYNDIYHNDHQHHGTQQNNIQYNDTGCLYSVLHLNSLRWVL
jgi:hypothetical protein